MQKYLIQNVKILYFKLNVSIYFLRYSLWKIQKKRVNLTLGITIKCFKKVCLDAKIFFEIFNSKCKKNIFQIKCFYLFFNIFTLKYIKKKSQFNFGNHKFYGGAERQ